MCGIAGFIGEGSRDDAERMIARLRHRGPDDVGVWYVPGGALAHARLSIIDLSPTGAQPMASAHGTVILVFNGEIYNYRELRSNLESHGYVFRGSSDTEVVANLYEQYSVPAFAMLKGMFALALYDHRDASCTIARDRFGEKPLFWSVQRGAFFFASELKALLAHSAYRGALDQMSIQKFLFSEYVPAPASIFQNTQKLEPGCWMRWKDAVITHGQYWHPSYQESAVDFPEATAQLDLLLNQATSRMVSSSDVPVGVLLSGGLDSSAVACAAQRASVKPIDTFSVAFDNPEFDESARARTVAATIGSNHHEIRVTERELLDIIPDIATIADEPLADPSLIPTACLARFVRQHVKVALGGDGADELLAGYATFDAERLARVLAFVPRKFWAFVEPFTKLLPASAGYLALDFIAQRFIRGMMVAPELRHPYWLSSFTPYEQSRLLVSPMPLSESAHCIHADLMRHFRDVKDIGSLNRLIHVYAKTYLVDDILVKVDRASMRYGLEVRAPFLDVDVAEYINTLPMNFKRRGGVGKFIVRSMLSGKLPSDIVNQKKHGFSLPLAAWFRGSLRDMSHDLLLSGTLCRSGMVNTEYVSRLLRNHIQGRQNNYKQIWTLMTLELWIQQWGSELSQS